MTKKTFKIYTLGCKVNQYDSRYLKAKLLSFGLKEGQFNNDLIIINTCAVTEGAIKKDKRIIKRVKKENPTAKLVILGCWSKIYRTETEEIKADLIWGIGDLDKLSTKIIELLSLEKNTKQIDNNILVSENRSRYFIKIQDGCEQFCSYCIIPYSRGKMTSRPEKEIIKEFKQAVARGFEEIVLTGIHLGLYGKDKGGKNLVKLLKQLIKIEALGRIRLSSIEITEVSDELIELINQTEKICPHLHIPLQSGSDKILKLMNRPYSTQFFKDKVKAIRIKVSKLALTTDIIVGFPGETEKEFKETLKLVEDLNFTKLHVFPFSAHEKAPASRFENQVEMEEIKTRSNLLKKLGEKLEQAFISSFANSNVYLVVERVTDKRAEGRTEYYFKANFSLSQLKLRQSNLKDLVGKIIKIRF